MPFGDYLRENFRKMSYCAFQSKTCELWSSKAAFTITFFAAVNHNYDHKQRTLKHRNTQNGSKSTSHKPWAFEPVALNLFPKRSAKMIYGSEKRKRQNSCVYEKRSRRSFITENVARYEKLKPVPSAKNVICVTSNPSNLSAASNVSRSSAEILVLCPQRTRRLIGNAFRTCR